MQIGNRNSQRLETKVGLRVDPTVVLNSQILQLTQQELEQAIETELGENPALERLQDDFTPLSEDSIIQSVAPQELGPTSQDYEFARSIPNDDGDSRDWTDFASSKPSLHDHLMAQMLTALPSEYHTIADFVVGAVNEKGYLTLAVEEIALSTCSSLEDAERVVARLRQCEPSGIGAYDVRDCLLLQLSDASTLERKLARMILKSHLDDFIHRRTAKLMRRFKVMPEVIESAFREIQALWPYPGESFDPPSTVGRRGSAVVPDLIFRFTEAGWELEILGANAGSLRIDRAYRHRYMELNKMNHPPEGEVQHISTYVRRASNFIQSIQQRRLTLKKIGDYLLEQQTGYIQTGQYQFLQPLTRSRLAQETGLHESTVSRATMGKHVQIATGEVIPFEVFFKHALKIQRMIEEILGNESSSKPLSDEQIAGILAKKGVHVARRTVNKYRDKKKLLSSRQRKSA